MAWTNFGSNGIQISDDAIPRYRFCGGASGFLEIGVGGVDELEFDQTDFLLNGTSGAYYIPWTSDKRPLYMETSNGGQITGMWLDTSTSPKRLYGVLDNSAQTIKVKIG